MDSECFEDTCPSTLRILDLPCPACVHDHSAFYPHYSAKHGVLHSSNSCFQLLMTLFPRGNWSPWKRTSASSASLIHCVTHPSRISTFPPTWGHYLHLRCWPQVESHWPHLSLNYKPFYFFFFQDYSYQYMIIYFSNIYQEHLSFSSLSMTSSVISFKQIAFSTCSHLKYQCSSFLCPKLLYFI